MEDGLLMLCQIKADLTFANVCEIQVRSASRHIVVLINRILKPLQTLFVAFLTVFRK